MPNMKKHLTVALIILVLLLACLVAWFMLRDFRSARSVEKNSSYSAVYLESGDIYFGKLKRFPRLHVENAWYLIRGVDGQNQPQVSVAPFDSVFWGPGKDMYVNPSQIMWVVRLRSDSPIVEALSASGLEAAPSTESGANILPQDQFLELNKNPSQN